MTLTKPLCTALFCLFSTTVQATDVTVIITGVASTKGTVNATLHDGADGFPQERQMVMGVFAPAAQDHVTLVFKGVAPGRYAITAFHDENGDGALSTNLLGIPNEPFGFSQNARGSFGPPSFDKAAFEVSDDNLTLTFSITK